MLSVEPSVRRGTELFEQFKRERGIPSLSERHAGSPEARRGAKLFEQRRAKVAAKRSSSLLRTPKQIRMASDPEHVIQPPGTVVGKPTRTGTNATRSFATPVSSEDESFFSDAEGALKMEGRVADAVRAGGPNPFVSMYEAAGRPMDASSSSVVSSDSDVESEGEVSHEGLLMRPGVQRRWQEERAAAARPSNAGELQSDTESDDETWSALEHGQVTHAPVGLHVARVKHAAAANKKPITYTKDSSMDKLVRPITRNVALYPLAAQLYAKKRIEPHQAANESYMRGLERELQAAKLDQSIAARQGDSAPGSRSSSAPPQGNTRFTSFKYSKNVPGVKLYKPPHTTQEPLYSDNKALWGAGAQCGGSLLGDAGSALGALGTASAITGIGAAPGAVIGTVGGVLGAADWIGESAGWW